jgi:DNA-binding NarL/FixJ family response regulator
VALWNFGKKKKGEPKTGTGAGQLQPHAPQASSAQKIPVGMEPAPELKEAAAHTADADMPRDAHSEQASAVSKLTPRERQVFELLCEGVKLNGIAETLGIKFSTVNTHQKSIYKKLGVNTRAECIIRYRK